MADRMRAHELATATEARRQLAAEVRKLAGLLDSQEPDYLVLHDAWEGLLELAEETERLRAQLLRRQPAQEASLIEKRPWLNPKLELIGKPKRSAGGSSSSRLPAASPSRRKQKAGQSSA
jgi:hypothetical protein